MKSAQFLLTLIVFLLMPAAIVRSDDLILRSSKTAKWYRGNMHTHSLWSDGDQYPEMIAQWYRDKGYQFLVFTDHNTLLRGDRWVDVKKTKGGQNAFEALNAAFPKEWVETRANGEATEVRLKRFDEIFERLAVPQEYLLIQGEEITDKFGSLPLHVCAMNLDELLPPLGGDSVTDVLQRNIDVARARRERTGVKSIVHLNHPNFGYAVTAEQLMPVVGEQFFEVYNGHPGVHNSGDATHVSTERLWDIVNSFRLGKLDLPLMYGLATDDGHSYFEKEPGKASQPGRGWVYVLAETLTPDALIDAMEAGRFYSSSGVTLAEIRHDSKGLAVVIEPDDDVTYRIDFVGTRQGFSEASEPATDDPKASQQMTAKYSDEIGCVLKSVEGTAAEYQFDGKELYVRAVITSSRKHPNPSEKGDFEQAWVQPVVPQTGDTP